MTPKKTKSHRNNIMSKDKDIAIGVIRSSVPETSPTQTWISNERPVDRKAAVYLLIIEEGSDAKISYYLCTRCEKLASHVEVIAQPWELSLDKLMKNKDIHLLLDKSKQTEMFVPWVRIRNIRNLTYRKI